MAITTMDGLVAGLGGAQRLVVNKANVVVAVAGRTMSLWSAAGQPGVGEVAAGATTTGVVPTSSTVGALSFVNPVSGSNSYLAGVRGFSAATGMIILYDVLWQWTSGGAGWSVTSTSSQGLSGGFPGLTRPDASGTNTELWLETLATGGTASGTLSVTYTNSAATPATTQTASIGAMISAPPVGTIQPLTLTAGDNGVKAVSALSHSATWTSGTYRLMIVRRLAEIPCTALTAFSYNAVDLGMPRIYDNACLGMAFSANATATGPLMMSLSLAQG